MVNKNKVGMVFSAFFLLAHLAWSLMVWFGLAQWSLDFIFGLHFIDSYFFVGEFAFGTAISLLIVASVVGYVWGFVIAALWNYFHK